MRLHAERTDEWRRGNWMWVKEGKSLSYFNTLSWFNSRKYLFLLLLLSFPKNRRKKKKQKSFNSILIYSNGFEVARAPGIWLVCMYFAIDNHSLSCLHILLTRCIRWKIEELKHLKSANLLVVLHFSQELSAPTWTLSFIILLYFFLEFFSYQVVNPPSNLIFTFNFSGKNSTAKNRH